MKYIILGILLFSSFKNEVFNSNNCTDIDLMLYNSIPSGPVGGGIGYENKILIDNSFQVVSTEQELIIAVNNPAVSKIFINSPSTIEIYQPIEIDRDNLVIAGDRGARDQNGKIKKGAEILLRHDASLKKPIFLIKSNNVRVSGIRLRSENILDEYTGIRLDGTIELRELFLTVDNCELSNFGYAGVQIDGHLNSLTNKIKSRINHNHIHNNNKSGLGYGIVINYKHSEAEIYYNWFDENRHSVAGNGRANEVYIAAYNFSLSNNMDAAEYDMHGFSDFSKTDCLALQNCSYNSSCNIAGEKVILLNNAVINSKYFFGLRGIPKDHAYVINNYTNSPNFYRIWRTWNESSNCPLQTPHDKNMYLSEDEWEQYNLSVCQNFNTIKSRNVYYVSWSGINNWVPLFFNNFNQSQAFISDFNNDNKSDLFVADGSKWHISNKSTQPLELINNSNYKLESLRFGDFDGNGSTDVFLADGNKWKVSWNGTSNWDVINNSGYKSKSLRFGDFDGNGSTDVFLADGNKWKVSWNGTSSWDVINNSSYKSESLRFGDFDGNGSTDVFLADGNKWKVSWNGTSSWDVINNSSYKPESLRFGDFDGNGSTDVFLADGNNWSVSWNGTSSWVAINNSSYKSKSLRFGDFDGDAKTDVLRMDNF